MTSRLLTWVQRIAAGNTVEVQRERLDGKLRRA